VFEGEELVMARREEVFAGVAGARDPDGVVEDNDKTVDLLGWEADGPVVGEDEAGSCEGVLKLFVGGVQFIKFGCGCGCG
jgi:hypothetical protein